MAVNLTAGAIASISSDLKPILQITDIRLLQGVYGGVDRYRLMLSDGVFQQQGMLATQHNSLVSSHQLQKGSVVHLTEFVSNKIRDRSVIIVINLNVILSVCPIIGDAIPSTQRAVPPIVMPTYSFLNEPGVGSVCNPEFVKDHPNPKRSRTSQFDETFGEDSIRCGLSAPTINSAKTTIELNLMEKKAVSNPNEKKKISPTIDECYNKLKGLGLEATNPIFLAAFCIFSQPDNCRESWMTLPSDPEVLKKWITMMAKSLGIMI